MDYIQKTSETYSYHGSIVRGVPRIFWGGGAEIC